MKINILDRNNCLLGYTYEFDILPPNDIYVYNLKHKLLRVVPETTTFKQIIDLLMREHTKQMEV